MNTTVDDKAMCHKPSCAQPEDGHVVSLRLDLPQFIEESGYSQPDERTLEALRSALITHLWNEIEAHWGDIAQYTGFDFTPANSEKGRRS